MSFSSPLDLQSILVRLVFVILLFAFMLTFSFALTLVYFKFCIYFQYCTYFSLILKIQKHYKMENTIKTATMSTSLDINDTLQKYLKGVMIAKKHRESQEGKQLEGFLKTLNRIAIKFLENHHDENCCSKQNDRHFEFQCMFHKEYVIGSYHRGDYSHLGMEQVEQFVTFMAAY